MTVYDFNKFKSDKEQGEKKHKDAESISMMEAYFILKGKCRICGGKLVNQSEEVCYTCNMNMLKAYECGHENGVGCGQCGARFCSDCSGYNDVDGSTRCPFCGNKHSGRNREDEV